MNTSKIVLAGNPNVGKSTVFNALTGLAQHTGNWSGKTVELASGKFCFDENAYEVYDLPGTYSIISNSPEEKIARDYLCFSGADLVVIVADATCLKRNLNLALQIMEINRRVLLCVNLIDEAKSNGILIDTNALSKKLGVSVIGICAKRKRDITLLKSKIAQLCNNSHKNENIFQIKYPKEIENAVAAISNFMTSLNITAYDRRLISLKLIDNRGLGLELLSKYTDDTSQVELIASAADTEIDNLRRQGIPPVAVRDMIADSTVAAAISVEDICISNSPAQTKNKTVLIDKYITSKKFGIPIMLIFFGGILWITIQGANYPSQLLSVLFARLEEKLKAFADYINCPAFVNGLLIDGIFGTCAWVTAVMLPPMAIFFPLFTLLEDLGFLPRIAFNLDKCFHRANSCGRQALTMCMGLGCNAVGVTGCRIIPSKRERLAAIITNTFMPCNGRFGLLITVSAIFIGGFFGGAYSSVISAIFVLLLIVIGTLVTLAITRILTSTILKGENTGFVLELPPYRRPQLLKTLTRSLLDRTLHILARALSVAAPAGAIVWLLTNTYIGNESILSHLTILLNPIGFLMGLDGAILLAFILAMPANEIVLPIILMCYLSSSQMVDVAEISYLADVLKDNGWTMLTAINVMLFSLLHFPCATTLRTIHAETGSIKWTFLAFVIPTLTGVSACVITNFISQAIYVLFCQ